MSRARRKSEFRLEIATTIPTTEQAFVHSNPEPWTEQAVPFPIRIVQSTRLGPAELRRGPLRGYATTSQRESELRRYPRWPVNKRTLTTTGMQPYTATETSSLHSWQ